MGLGVDAGFKAYNKLDSLIADKWVGLEKDLWVKLNKMRGDEAMRMKAGMIRIW